MAQIIAFPLARRHKLIHRAAARMSELNAAGAEKHIHNLLKQQADAMRRRGITDDMIANELRRLEAAIRSALWMAVINAPGEAG